MDIGTPQRIVEVEPVQDPFRQEPAPEPAPERELEPERETVEVPA